VVGSHDVSEKLRQARAWQKTWVNLRVLGTRSPIEPSNSWLWPVSRSAIGELLEKVSSIQPSWRQAWRLLTESNSLWASERSSYSTSSSRTFYALHPRHSLGSNLDGPILPYLQSSHFTQILDIKFQSSYVDTSPSAPLNDSRHSPQHPIRYPMLLQPIYS
jgi:hypothetical protein